MVHSLQSCGVNYLNEWVQIFYFFMQPTVGLFHTFMVHGYRLIIPYRFKSHYVCIYHPVTLDMRRVPLGTGSLMPNFDQQEPTSPLAG